MVEFVVKQEGERRRLVVNCKGLPYGPDVAQFPECMRMVIDILKTTEANEVVLSEFYERIYNEDQTRMLKSIADAITRFETEAVWSPSHLGTTTETKIIAARHDAVMGVMSALYADPFAAYLNLMKMLKAEEERSKALTGAAAEDARVYKSTLNFMREVLENTAMIRRMKEYLAQLGAIPTGRGMYVTLFETAIKPSFIGSRIFFGATEKLELIDQYNVLGTPVYIYKHPDQVQPLYYINPPEYTLPPEKYFLLEKTKEVVAGRRPEAVGFMDMAQARKYFHKIYVGIISDLAAKNKIPLTVEEKEDLATIVTRYTIGYGILEIILSDRQITDTYLDSPLGVKPIYVVHSKYGQCQTNVIFTEEEARAVVSRFRALSGRPFDEAHPILDFDLTDLMTRVCVIGKPLATDGIAFAFRLHKTTPWTLPQFLDVKMLNPLCAGMLSMFVDAQASMLIVGSRGSGKTSFLQALMLEIPQNLRIIVQEDSVAGDCGIVIERNSRLEKTTVGKLIDELIEKYGCEKNNGREILSHNPEKIKVFAADKTGKIKLTEVSKFIRHRVNKDIYLVKTRAGREIKVTKDHSLFTLGEDGLKPILTGELAKGSYIATPRRLEFPQVGVKSFNAMKHLLEYKKGYLEGVAVSSFIKENYATIKKIAFANGHNRSLVSYWARKGIIPISIYSKVGEGIARNNLFFKLDRKAKSIPVEIDLNEDFLTLIGLWLADGCYDGRYGVVFSVDDEESRSVVRKVAERLGLKVRMHSDGISLIVSNTGFVYFLKNVFGLQGDAFTKKLPGWAFNLSKKQAAALLRGLFSGDGCASKNEVLLNLCAKDLIKDVQTLLLSFGVVSRLSLVDAAKLHDGKTHCLRIGSVKMQRAFKQIGFLQSRKNKLLEVLCNRISTHDSTDVVPLTTKMKRDLSHAVSSFNYHDYISRGYSLGREKLQDYLASFEEDVEPGDLQSFSEMPFFSKIADSDIFWDEVKSVKPLGKTEEYVYDFSVPECENFVCENIIAHNTLELPVPYMKSVGYNIQRLKTRPPLGGGTEAEPAAEDALRTALRLGDSVLIVGEVRSTEARALYEAMRVGAVGNVVMGTIHGESAYSIWDRVVNDLGVPTTSFKATDFCIVTAPIRFKGALKRERRVIEVTEVKKHWEHDPYLEGGFLQWMQFDATKDDLEILMDNVKESEWIERIKRVRGLTFDEIWAEVNARGAAKQYLVEQKRKYDIPRLLESDYTVRAHNKYMLMADQLRAQYGKLDHQMLLAEWKRWVDENLVRELVAAKRL